MQKILCLTLGLLGAACSAPPHTPGQGPHIVVVSIDSLRPDHMSLYGYDRQTTPVLEKLAKHAVIYDAAFAAHTRSGPAHASIMSGLYPQTHGALRHSHQMRRNVQTLAQILKQRGYRTGGFVSAYPLPRRFMNLQQGFDVYDDGLDPKHGTRRGDQTLAVAQTWLSHNTAATPTFLFLHLQEPSAPYAAPGAHGLNFLEDGRTRYHMPMKIDRRRLSDGNAQVGEIEEYIARYDAEIAYTDSIVGHLWDTLRQLGYWDNTVLVLLSAHGETLNERRWMFDHGARVYEEQIRVPLIIRLPSDEHTGKHVRSWVHHVDVYPTILDFLGLRVPNELPGRSLIRPIQDDEPRSGRPVYSLARPNPDSVPEASGHLTKDGVVTSVRQYPWKLISYPTRGGGEYQQLFNLSEDPGELKNVSENFPSVLKGLSERLSAWWKSAIPKAQ